MFLRLLLAFSLIPLIELALLIKVGSYMGVLPTIILVAGTGVLGVSLARSQGFQLFNQVRQTLEKGQLPADHLIEGLLILIGSVMLLTPGLLTDITGFTLIIPATRKIVARFAKIKFRHWIEKGRINVSYGEYRQHHADPQHTDSKEASHPRFGDDRDESIDVDFKDLKD